MNSRTKNLIKVLFFLCFILINLQLLSHRCGTLSQVQICKTSGKDDVEKINTIDTTRYVKSNIFQQQKIQEITKCKDTIQVPSIEQNGDYWILYNYATSKYQFKCSESITYTTHGDFSFLNNLEPLVTKWKGPISIALYAPGDDLQNTIDSITYLRFCGPEIIRNFVTFHIYFSNQHMPESIPNRENVSTIHECGTKPPYIGLDHSTMYKNKNNLTYPVNVARNIARKAAQTHFILASDIELYPSKDLIKKFLEMIARNEAHLLNANPKVFSLPLFEVLRNETIPENKTKLQEMLRNKTAFQFHKKICSQCHNVPMSQQWEASVENDEINIFHVGKRIGSFNNWEPIYIGTNAEPYYEERQSWEGKRDKMTQGYALCVLDYDIMILDNAFLVHKPGVKIYKSDHRRDVLSAYTSTLISRKIYPELKVLFGERSGCTI